MRNGFRSGEPSCLDLSPPSDGSPIFPESSKRQRTYVGCLSSATHTAFASFALSPATLRAIDRAGYRHPTPIQAKALPPALKGADVIGCAATGTGKTAAFLLPMIERLADKRGTRGLVLAPTRELVLQIAEQLEVLGAGRNIRGVTLIGGASYEHQARALRAQPRILVATPGRLVDHLQQGSARLSDIEVLVLDEADRMLDMGFKPQLTRILAKLPRTRQTLLFSATVANEVADFAKRHLSSPIRVEADRSGTTAARAEQAVYLVSQTEKQPLLLALLGESEETTLVFTRTKRRADKVSRVLERAGHSVARIHADRSQAQRRHALEGFKRGKYRVLVATDIAARGIDVEEIGHVINYDMPHIPEDYVHRIGRTARAAASGKAFSFVSREERDMLKNVERLTRTLIPRKDVPRDDPLFIQELKRLHDAQSDPGPPQRNFGKSSRPAGHPPGRHARTHR
jgi:ATP-dependent RNA helicase RhlE